MAHEWGATTAEAFFARCCPQLLRLGAVAYWTLPAGGAYPRLRRTVEEVTQCVFAVGDDRLRIAKAEGRPAGVAGTVFRCRSTRAGRGSARRRSRPGSARRCARRARSAT